MDKTQFRRTSRHRRLLGRLWTIEDFMHFAQLGKNKVYELINKKEITYTRTHGDSGHIRFAREDVWAWVERNKQQSKYDAWKSKYDNL